MTSTRNIENLRRVCIFHSLPSIPCLPQFTSLTALVSRLLLLRGDPLVRVYPIQPLHRSIPYALACALS